MYRWFTFLKAPTLSITFLEDNWHVYLLRSKKECIGMFKKDDRKPLLLHKIIHSFMFTIRVSSAS